MPFDLTIFDYDGVLIDSLADAISAGSEFCRSMGHDRLPTEAVIRSLQKMTYFELARALGLPDHEAEQFSHHTFNRFQTIAPSMPFYPEIEHLLNKMGSKNVAIVSGNAKTVISAKLSAHGLDSTVPCILGALEPGDKAEKIGRACRFFGVPPHRACMVGDSVSDIRHAKQAGVQSIAATWGWQSREQLAVENPDFIVDTVGELAVLLGAD